MTDFETYPKCLCRPDAGGNVQTRTTQTIARYRTRFASMIRTLCRQRRWMSADALDLAIDLGERAFRYTKNSLKQYHGAIRQNLRDRWVQGSITLKEIEDIDALLRSHRPARRYKKSELRTSAGRAKSVRPEQISAIVSALLIHPTPIRQIAAALLEHGVNLGTRPSEFLSIKQDVQGRFWVRSAKFSEANRRGLERVRIVHTDDYEGWEIAELRGISELIATEQAGGATTQRLLRRCQRAIRLARKDFGSRSSRVVAYTVRHQARANFAAMGMRAEEVAVIMGHANAGTAQSHYAPARSGWHGMTNRTPPTVDPALVAMVRPAHPSRGWEAQGNRPPKSGPKF